MKDLVKIIGLGIFGVATIALACKKDKNESKRNTKIHTDGIEAYYDLGLTDEEKEQLWEEYKQERRNRK